MTNPDALLATRVEELAARLGIRDTRYCELAQEVCEAALATSDIPVVRVSGAQGSGKSTFAELLALTMTECFGKRAAILSLDDFYMTHAERRELSRTRHPLLAVRGVPGTHDVPQMVSALTALRSGKTVETPVFDKAVDDRAEQTRNLGPADVIITEGWCLGASAQPEAMLATPVNRLEAEQDPQGEWRRYVHRQLAELYPPLFEADVSVFLQVPGMEQVFAWRLEQEERLRRERGSAGFDEVGVRDFIAHYERITLWMLRDLPGRVSFTARLDEAHKVAEIQRGG